MDELAKAHIKHSLERGEDISDGADLGREAAATAIGAYITAGPPQAAIEAAAGGGTDAAGS